MKFLGTWIVFLSLLAVVFSVNGLAYGQTFEEYSVKVETIAENLEVPWAIAFSSDDRIFFTERVGKLRVIENGELNPDPLIVLGVGGGEGGLLGLALDPDFEKNHYLYLYQTYNEFLSTYNKVVRYTVDQNQLLDETILLDKIPGAVYHDGGRIKFGPDNKLYIATGDAGNPDWSQDIDSLAGKILRMNSDGTIPEDNPFENSLVFSYGHRNPQGFDWDKAGIMVATEHGPSGERGRAHDEVNLIEVGKNYGWPEVVGDESENQMINPILHTGSSTWAPSGASFYHSDNVSEWEGSYFIGTLRGNHLRMLDLDLQNGKVLASEALFEGEFGRIRDASMGPDGNLYLLTSNRDGRGSAGPNDDRILRIVSQTEQKKMDGEETMKKGDSKFSPKKQMEMGIDPHMVQCKEGLSLVFKDKVWSPACVKETSVARLIEIGWAADHDPYHNGINMPK